MRLKGQAVEGNKKRRGVPEGRMRLLLAESSDYKDLRLKIDDIKESDSDSETIGRKWECHELLDKLFGDDHEQISVKIMLGKDNQKMLDELNEESKRRICSDWKKYLDIALHSLHYSKGGNR